MVVMVMLFRSSSLITGSISYQMVARSLIAVLTMEGEPTPVLNIISSKISTGCIRPPATVSPHLTTAMTSQMQQSWRWLVLKGCACAAAILVTEGGWGLVGTDGDRGPASAVGFAVGAGAGAAANCL